MSNRTISILVVAVIIAMGLLFIINFTNLYWHITPEKYLSHHNIKGMEVVHDGKSYTLNFEQQNLAVDILNQAVTIGYETYFETKETQFPYDHLIIYKFDGSDVEITPVGFVNLQLLFKAPEWNPDGLMRETGPGRLNKLLSEALTP